MLGRIRRRLTDRFAARPAPVAETRDWLADWSSGRQRRAHPLAEFRAPLPAHDRWAVLGPVGAGNMLLQAVLRGLTPEDATPQGEPRVTDEAVRRAADDQAAVLTRWCRDRCAAAGLNLTTGGYTLSPGRGARAVLRVDIAAAAGPIVVRGLPWAGFIGNPYGSHAAPDGDMAAFLDRFGYRRVFLICRDPLATLASEAAKTAGGNAGLARLRDAAWLSAAGERLARYLAAAGAFAAEPPPEAAVVRVRFERLLNDPAREIRRIAAALDRPCDEATAESLWKRVGHRSLTPAGRSHYRDPLADKRRLFRPADVERLSAAGLDDQAFAAAGAEPPSPDELAPNDPSAPTAPDESDASDELPTSTDRLYGQLRWEQLHHRFHPSSGMTVSASDPALAASIEAAFVDPVVGMEPFRAAMGPLLSDSRVGPVEAAL